MECLGREIQERGHDDPIAPVVATQGPRQQLLVRFDGWGRGLDVEIDCDVGVVVQQVQNLVERGYAEIALRRRTAAKSVGLGGKPLLFVTAGNEPIRVVERAQLLEREGVYRTVPVGRAVHGSVVTNHKLAVRRRMNVELDPARSELECPADGEKSRRRRLPGASLVRIGEDAAREPGVRGPVTDLGALRAGFGRGHFTSSLKSTSGRAPPRCDITSAAERPPRRADCSGS